MYIGKQENSPWRTDWFVKASFPIVQGKFFNASRRVEQNIKANQTTPQRLFEKVLHLLQKVLSSFQTLILAIYTKSFYILVIHLFDFINLKVAFFKSIHFLCGKNQANILHEYEK